jgi:hypothetical protein
LHRMTGLLFFCGKSSAVMIVGMIVFIAET